MTHALGSLYFGQIDCDPPPPPPYTLAIGALDIEGEGNIASLNPTKKDKLFELASLLFRKVEYRNKQRKSSQHASAGLGTSVNRRTAGSHFGLRSYSGTSSLRLFLFSNEQAERGCTADCQKLVCVCLRRWLSCRCSRLRTRYCHSTLHNLYNHLMHNYVLDTKNKSTKIRLNSRNLFF